MPHRDLSLTDEERHQRKLEKGRRWRANPENREKANAAARLVRESLAA